MSFGRVSRFCSTRGTRRVNLVTNPVISHERGKDLFLLFPVSQVLCVYIHGIPLAKSGLLIDRTSSLYLKVRLNALASVLFCLCFCVNSDSYEYRKRLARRPYSVPTGMPVIC